MTKTRSLAAGEFKQTCLRVLDQVARDQIEVTITKRGKPVARLVPLVDRRDREAVLLAELRGRVRLLVDEAEFLRPLDVEAGWKLNG